MKSVEVEGKTVEEALNKALSELDANKDMVDIEILDHGSKGLFNVIGVKPARIRVSRKYNYIEEARNFIVHILKGMEVEATIDIKEENDSIIINLSGEKMGVIIGYRGETLDSIQYLVSLVVNKLHELPHKKVILDTEDYRSKREETLKGVAIKTANRVKKTKKSFKLEPMNPYERRIIHSALQEDAFVNTYSEGEEPFRRVVVELKKD
ncbi:MULTISPECIES: RNA-binding cell elongation regulator Jag/EloR [Clostridium]|jgi:Predicted RNA-binding protein|uniref:RNA-binding protein KhpB n=4 Tax=Clostridium TaxID=1485 RepID=A0A1S8P584_CLOBE|nr:MULTISPECIES: RNA-binding cell elongation regulator Jag/EloR [Clostridium]ABR37206.1 single-stranded nucleic acid binding R3H domain protein [Clostridium beijerinckii NCIMB 8052]AIU03844.1 single-stranded nucleic acid binding R3H domain-containing protein [Clostridium beijerinckii ATCC 35702]ALB43796.1 protein jag [Clostridium beijerinckii NRRL B-598]AVK49057.1 DNA-binding protein [Clostridium sp. MF28]MBC2458937.1 protein jag [Clostridium beijerinckii]